MEISDPDARNLDEAFKNMWTVAGHTRCTKPLHHISINPYKDERLTDEQVLKIVERCEQKFGYKPGEHQRVIVEHIKDGRQHFHVIWNRVSLDNGRPVWPGHHWKKAKQAAREMEKELGLKRPQPRRSVRKAKPHTRKRTSTSRARIHPQTPHTDVKLHASSCIQTGLQSAKGFTSAVHSRLQRTPEPGRTESLRLPRTNYFAVAARRLTVPLASISISPRWPRERPHRNVVGRLMPSADGPMSRAELIAWAWANARWDILYALGVLDYWEP